MPSIRCLLPSLDEVLYTVYDVRVTWWFVFKSEEIVSAIFMWLTDWTRWPNANFEHENFTFARTCTVNAWSEEKKPNWLVYFGVRHETLASSLTNIAKATPKLRALCAKLNKIENERIQLGQMV